MDLGTLVGTRPRAGGGGGATGSACAILLAARVWQVGKRERVWECEGEGCGSAGELVWLCTRHTSRVSVDTRVGWPQIARRSEARTRRGQVKVICDPLPNTLATI